MFIKQPEIIIIGFGEKNVSCPKYIDIYEFLLGMGGGIGTNMVHHSFFVYYSKKIKYKSMTYTKIKFYIILINFFFLG